MYIYLIFCNVFIDTHSLPSFLKFISQGYKSQQSGVTEMSQKIHHQTSVIESLELELNQLKQERQIERQRQQEEVNVHLLIVWGISAFL